MEVRREKIWLRRDEFVEALEIQDRGRIQFYSYTYRIDRGTRGWRPAVRWDNHEGVAHVDRFDANQALIEQKPCPEKSLDDILKIVRSFGRNLMAMDVSQL